MAKNAKRIAAKGQTATKQASAPRTAHEAVMNEKPVPRISEAVKEATTLAIKVHRRALKELEKH